MKTKVRHTITLIAILSLTAACSRNGMDSQNDALDGANSPPLSIEDTAQVSAIPQNVEDVDSTFVIAAIQSGLMEVQLGELAQRLASSSQVKSFGKSMMIDHGKANQELQALARKFNISSPETLSETSRVRIDSLSQLKGSAFDKAYAATMVREHRKAVTTFSNEAGSGQQTELAEWSHAKVPTLAHHLLMAEKMYNALDQTPGKQ